MAQKKKPKFDLLDWKPFWIHDPRKDVSDAAEAYKLPRATKETIADVSRLLNSVQKTVEGGDNAAIARVLQRLALQILEWLSDAAHVGNEQAQRSLMQVGNKAGALSMLAMQHKLPAAVKMAEVSTHMPGLISNLPHLQSQAAEICSGVGLGKRTKFQRGSRKKAEVGLATRVNVLAVNLLDYIKSYQWVIEDSTPEFYIQHFQIDPLVAEIISLPKLVGKPVVVNQWAAVCIKIIERGNNYSSELMECYRSDLLAAIKDALQKLAK